ncbi:MAG: DUF192 domain-containing protein [Undibacterium sp.]|nr:DUF192 domain-containing protein [Undibacterium sp.]
MRHIFLSLVVLQTSALFAQDLNIKELSINQHVIKAEFAFTPAAREKGLMNRTQMDEEHGMLFKFDKPAQYCMWMKNTLIPLSVAFIDKEGKILNIEDMQANTEESHCAKGEAMFALEMNLAWFTQKQIVEGSSVRGIRD